MIIKTNKKDALELIQSATRRLDNETFLQCNMVGCDWLFVIANNNWYITVNTDKVRKQFSIRVYNHNTKRETSELYNTTAPTMQAIHDYFLDYQMKNVYGVTN